MISKFIEDTRRPLLQVTHRCSGNASKRFNSPHVPQHASFVAALEERPKIQLSRVATDTLTLWLQANDFAEFLSAPVAQSQL
jgi:hypothetical protein